MLRRDYIHHRSRLVLETGEERYLRQLAGLSRFAYNRGLEWEEERRATELPLLEVQELEARFRALCREPDQEWTRSLPKDVWRNALKHLRRAYKLHDEQHLQRTTKDYHRNPPRRKRRGHSKMSYILSRPRIEIENPGRRRRITVIDACGHRYRLHNPGAFPEHLEQPYQATVKELEGIWFITLSFREPTVIIRPQGEPVGVDMGFKQMAVDSNGNRYEWRELPRGEQRREQRLRRRLRGTELGSNHHRKLQAKLDRIRYRRRCIEWDTHYQTCARVLRLDLPAVERPARVVVDRIKLTEIAEASPTLEVSVKKQSLYQLYLKLRVKARRQGTEFVEANQWYPSSKSCSDCGNIDHGLKLSTRTYTCSRCGLVLDRDENAARNLRDYEADWLAVINGKERRHLERELDRLPGATTTTIPEELDAQLLALSKRRTMKAHGPIGQEADDGKRDNLEP